MRRMKTIGLSSAMFGVALAAVGLPAIAQTPLAQSKNAELVAEQHGFTGGHVSIEGDRLYLGSYGVGFRIYDISKPDSPELLGTYSPLVRADAVPDAARFGGREIVAFGGTSRSSYTQRTEFVDTTDPSQPELLHTFMGADDGEAHNSDIVDKRKLWLPSGGSGANGLRIFDMRPLLHDKPAAPKELYRADPFQLWQASPYRDEDSDPGHPFTHTHDITVYTDYKVLLPEERWKNGRPTYAARDIALLAEGGSYGNNTGNTGSVFIIDITNPRRPLVLYRFLHEAGEGHHPIRYHHEAQFLDGDPHLMLVTDEDLHNGCGNSGGITALRVSPSLTSAEELSEWFIPLGTPAPVCSAHVFSSHGDLVFMGSYNAGLQVIDYSKPTEPIQAGYYIAEGANAWGAQYHKGLIYQGDWHRGLDVFRYVPPEE